MGVKCFLFFSKICQQSTAYLLIRQEKFFGIKTIKYVNKPQFLKLFFLHLRLEQANTKRLFSISSQSAFGASDSLRQSAFGAMLKLSRDASKVYE